MKAITYTKYGGPDVLHLTEVKKPQPKETEVLIEVYATSVNSWDWDLLTGKPRLYRLLFGLFKPKFKILGSDVAGKVVSVGEATHNFKPGDNVFGDIAERWGCFAEFVCADENMLSHISPKMNFEEAAAIPQAAVLAWQSLHDKKPVTPGDKILINGAGGGVGTFAVQIAKHLGAEVSVVDASEKLEMLRILGADHLIEYKKTDYTKNGEQYDLVIDMVANRSLFAYKRALKPKGIFVMVGGSISSLLQIGILGPLISAFGSRKLSILMHKPNKDIALINKLFEEGIVKPIIEKCYLLSEVPKAMQQLGAGKAMGKLVISVKSGL